MRPLTRALLRGNSESLKEKGWKQDEQCRCFKKADALLDYIGRIKPSEYSQGPYYKKLSEQRAEGIKYCLEKDMPSSQMRGRSLEILSALLSIGEELLIRAAWLYKNYPVLFKAKYALSPETFEKDANFYFVRGRVVPEHSFPSFKTGKNPAISRNDDFLNKCVEMYQAPVFDTPEFKTYSKQMLRRKYPYFQWLKDKKAGMRFSSEKQALSYVINRLALENKVQLNPNKSLLLKQLLQKKQKTI